MRVDPSARRWRVLVDKEDNITAVEFFTNYYQGRKKTVRGIDTGAIYVSAPDELGAFAKVTAYLRGERE